VPLILGALWPEEQGNHVKPERRGELKKRKEEKAIKGKRIMKGKELWEFECLLCPASLPALATSFETWDGGVRTSECSCA